MRKRGKRGVGRRFDRRRRERETCSVSFFPSLLFPFTDRHAGATTVSLLSPERRTPGLAGQSCLRADLNVLRDARSARIPLHFLTIRHWRLIRSECRRARRVWSHSCPVAGRPPPHWPGATRSRDPYRQPPPTRRQSVTWNGNRSPPRALREARIPGTGYGRGAGSSRGIAL